MCVCVHVCRYNCSKEINNENKIKNCIAFYLVEIDITPHEAMHILLVPFQKSICVGSCKHKAKKTKTKKNNSWIKPCNLAPPEFWTKGECAQWQPLFPFERAGNRSPQAGRAERAERERKVAMRLHRGAPANVSSSDLTARLDQSRITASQVHRDTHTHSSISQAQHSVNTFAFDLNYAFSIYCLK